MRLMNTLRQWWQLRTGDDENPFDADSSAWLVSFVLHLAVLFIVGAVTIYSDPHQRTLKLVASPHVEEPDLVTEEFRFDEQAHEEIGALSRHGAQMAASLAATTSELPDVPALDVPSADVAQIEQRDPVEFATALDFSNTMQVKGDVGVGTKGAVGAIDRLTHEIMLSMDERPTVVAWLFDQSGSLNRQREAIRKRMARVYDELGVVQSGGRYTLRDDEQPRLKSTVVAFGETATWMIKRPTSDVEELMKAIEDIQQDDSGTENVLSTIRMVAEECRRYRRPKTGSSGPAWNVKIIVFSDEAGNDAHELEPAIKICQQFGMGVYVVGVPAPFGRLETLMKWVDPDPDYDQTPQMGIVEQGPESLYLERLRLTSLGISKLSGAIDSGFGPFALTRICYETGGIYFVVHPQIDLQRRIGRRESVAFTAYFSYFFDREIMRRYRPDYVSERQYLKELKTYPHRAALVEAARMSWVSPMEYPETHFIRQDEASFAAALLEAQKVAAKLEPRLAQLQQILKGGEKARPQETRPRWQAGYDLAMGRVLATKVRTEGYDAMLAQAKGGLEVRNERNNTFDLVADEEISTGGRLESEAMSAQEYLQRVVDEHPDTPWSLLAQRELSQPLGWSWEDSYTDLDPPPPSPLAAEEVRRRDDEARKLERPKPKRGPPRL